MRTIAGASALLLGLLAAGCNGELVGGGLTPAQVLVVSGDMQSGTVGEELAQPLVVRVVDERDRPVRNQLVNFVVTAGGGSVFAGSAITNAQGEARERWKLGTVAGDTQRVEARAVDPSTGQALVFATFRAIGTPGAPAALAAVGSLARTGMTGQPIADSLAVKVSDQYGNGVPGVTVTWSAGAGSGTVSPGSNTTGADGVARAQWTLGMQVTAQQTAMAAAAGRSVQFQAQATPSYTLVRVSGDGQNGITGTALADSLVVKAVDAAGAPVAGVTVQWVPQTGPGRVDGSASPQAGVSGPDGTVRTQWTLGATAGQQRISAQAPYGPGSSTGADFYATAVTAAPPRVSTDSVRPNGSTAVGWGTVWPEGKAGTSWFERGSQPDLSDAQVVGSQAFAAGDGPIHRSLALAPAPGETVYFRIAASNAYGTARGQILSFNDSPPQLNVTSPHMGQVARPNLRIDVDCVGACTSVGAFVVTGIGRGTEVATVGMGTTGIHADVSLAAYDGTRVRVRIRAADSAGRITERDFEIFVESSTRLTELFSAGDRLLDYDATRALVGDQAIACCISGSLLPWAVRMIDRASGTQTLLASGQRGGHYNSYTGWLHPQGALFISPGGLFDWRNGTLTGVDASGHLAVAGNWAAHMKFQVPGGYPVIRRNLATGASEQVASNGSPGGAVDVAENGDVVYDGTDSDVHRYRGGTLEDITTGGNSDPGGTIYRGAVTDGTLVAFQAATSSGPPRLMLYTGTSTLDLGPLTDNRTGETRRQLYEVENGWTAYLLADAGGVAQVWVRSPTGEVRQASSVSQSASIRSLGPNGEVVFASGGRVYVAKSPYTSAAVQVFHEPGAYDLKWRGGDLLLFLGRTAFRVDY
jgi:Bacterial Ig-like domain (group 1)